MLAGIKTRISLFLATRDECGPAARGAASTADGGDFAFGNTEEALIVIVLCVAERGAPADGPLQRAGARQGHGWVRATTTHDYADAQRRGIPCSLSLVSRSRRPPARSQGTRCACSSALPFAGVGEVRVELTSDWTWVVTVDGWCSCVRRAWVC